MITVTVDNSNCHIHGLSDAQFKKLRELLTYRVPAQGRVDLNDPRTKRPLLTKRGDFPTGLLYLVRRFLAKHRLRTQWVDKRVLPASRLRLKATLTFPPYPEQKAAAEAARRNCRGIVCMPTGSGKSVVAALIIEQLQVRTLVVVPSVELRGQLADALSDIFGAKHVGKGRDIWVANVDSLDPSAPLHNYDCVIIDEFHHSAATTYRKLNTKAWAGVYYKLGLTATPYRSQDHERLLLESVLSRTIYRLSYQDAVDKGYIVPVEAYYVELPKRAVEGYTWASVYKELVTENESRNALVLELLNNLEAAGKSALCLVKEVAHGESLAPFPFANGQDGQAKGLISNFNRRKINVLVGTEGVLSEGVDTKPCEYVIITGLGKSRPAFMQKCGRGFRRYTDKTSCKIILFYDKSHKFTRDHFRTQCRILKEEYGILAIKLT